MPDYSHFGTLGFLTPSDTLAGSWPGSAQGRPNPASGVGGPNDPNDYGVIDPATGKVVSLKTGKPWTGREPRSGQYYTAGVQSAAPVPVAPPATPGIDPADVAKRYKTIDLPKFPEVSDAAQNLLKTFKTGADQAIKGFGDYLGEYQKQIGAANKATQEAIAFTGQDEADMRAEQQRYSAALDAAGRQYADLNAQGAATQRGIVGRAQALLPEYDRAAANIGDYQTRALVNQLGRYKSASGTPTSLGSDEERLLSQGVADIRLPLEQARIGRRYDILTGLELPIERDILGRETSRVTQFGPMVAGQQYQTGVETDRAIADLKIKTAGMSYENAARYLQSLGIPAQLWSQILGAQIANLGGLTNLLEGSRYTGITDLLQQENLSKLLAQKALQPEYYSQAGGGYPGPSVPGASPPGGGPSRYNPLGGSNAPQNVGGEGPGFNPTAADIAYQNQTGAWPQSDPNFSSQLYNQMLRQFSGVDPGLLRYSPAYDAPVAQTPVGPGGGYILPMAYPDLGGGSEGVTIPG